MAAVAATDRAAKEAGRFDIDDFAHVCNPASNQQMEQPT
jgi:hypothetical protein